MEIKSYLKNQFALKHSGDYFSLAAPPVNTCTWINDVKKKIEQISDSKLKAESIKFKDELRSSLEEFRGSCDSIRKEVLIAKDRLWSLIDDMYQINPDHQGLIINEAAQAKFNSLIFEIYTEADTLKLDRLEERFFKELKIKNDLPELELIFNSDLICIKENIFKLDSWRSQYFNLINEQKHIVLTSLEADLNKLNLKMINR